MADKHGVYTSEVPTSLIPFRTVGAGLPFVVGIAPIWKATSPATVNEPVLISSATEAAKYLGFESTDDFDAYTLSEFLYSVFGLFNVGPCVVVNVFDPSVHKTAVTDESLVMGSDKLGQLAHVGILTGTLAITPTGGGTAYTAGTDYVVDLVTGLVSLPTGSAIAAGATVKAAYSYADPSKVTKADIIGGIDVTTLKPEGLECVSQVFPRFRKVVGQIHAPKFSTAPDVAAVMAAKTVGLNGHFKCLAIVDVPTTGTGAVTHYSNVAAYKNDNNLVDEHLVVCWPKVKLGDKEYHLSCQLAGVMLSTDADNDDVPYVSPSNKSLQATAAILAGGETVWLDTQTAADLNGAGIVTALNFIGGWKLWGNRTACYPDVTDVKDAFIPIRRMFNWVGNSLIQTFWQKVDNPGNRRLIETVVDSCNIWLNGLSARQYILGGRVEFRSDENPTTDLMDGKFRFHVYITPPSPAEEIDFILEYDPSYIETLFG